MIKTPFLLGGAALLLILSGCVTTGSSRRPHHQGRVEVRASLTIEDDYEYYPHHEVYYSRRRNEYVYRESNTWVRRQELQGITLAVLTAGPMVRMDFRDSPEHHHGRIVQRYPRNWQQSGSDQRDQNNRQADRKSDAQQERRDDRKDDREDRKEDRKDARDDRKDDRKDDRDDRKDDRKDDRDDRKDDRKKDRKDDDKSDRRRN